MAWILQLFYVYLRHYACGGLRAVVGKRILMNGL
jgi:hypothetical protein